MFKFSFLGGQRTVNLENGRTAKIKFYVFAVSPQLKNEQNTLSDNVGEVIHFTAINKGLFEPINQDEITGIMEYSSKVRYLKIFSSIAGFGIPQKYLSQYIELDNNSDKRMTIYSIPFKIQQRTETIYSLSVRGRLLTPAEVGELVGITSKSYNYFRSQTRFTKTDVRKMITIETIDIGSGRVRPVRMLRV